MIGLIRRLAIPVAGFGIAGGLTANRVSYAGFDLIAILELIAVIVAALVAAFRAKKK